MALRTRPTQFPELASGVATEQLTAASRLVSYLTGFTIQPNKAIVGGNAFAHESGIHQDGVIKNPLTYEIMTPQSVGLSGSQLTIGKLSGRRGLQGKLKELGYELEGEALDEIYRQAVALADAKKEVTDADLHALVEQRASEVPASVAIVGWSVTSSHGGNATGQRHADRRRRGPDRRGDRQRPGQRALQRGRRRPPAGPRLAPDPDRVRDQGRVRRRGRPGPGPGPLPALVGRGAGRPRRDRARVIARTSSRPRSRPISWPSTSSTARRSTACPWRSSRRARARPCRDLSRRDHPGRRRRAGGRRRPPGASSTRPAPASGSSVDWSEFAVGGIAIDTYGVAIRDEDVAACGAADAILLGAVGGPKWSDPAAAVRPEQALFALRGGLGLYANLRPVSVQPALAGSSPLRPELLAGVDMLIVRELTGGVYFGDRTEAAAEPGARSALDTLPYAEHEIERIVRLAFELARTRRGAVTSVDKANVLATSRLWRRIADEIATEYPDVRLNHQLVDSCAMLLIRRPADFDVIVTENLFGDILSDEAAVLAGSLGVLPSASLGARRTEHGQFGLYEPIHGSAPDIAGRDIANPIGTILSAAMLLRTSLGTSRRGRGRSRRRSAGRWTTAGGPATWPTRAIRPTASSWSARPPSRRRSSRRSPPARAPGSPDERPERRRPAGRPVRHDPARRDPGREHHPVPRRQAARRADARRVRDAVHRGRLARLEPQGHRVLRGRPVDALGARPAGRLRVDPPSRQHARRRPQPARAGRRRDAGRDHLRQELAAPRRSRSWARRRPRTST